MSEIVFGGKCPHGYSSADIPEVCAECHPEPVMKVETFGPGLHIRLRLPRFSVHKTREVAGITLTRDEGHCLAMQILDVLDATPQTSVAPKGTK